MRWPSLTVDRIVPRDRRPAVLVGLGVLIVVSTLRAFDGSLGEEVRRYAVEQLDRFGPGATRPAWASAVEQVFAFVAGVLSVLLTVRLRGRMNPLPPLVLVPLWLTVVLAAHLYLRLDLDPTFPVFAVVLPLPAVIGLNMAAIEQAHHRLEADLALERTEKERLEGELLAARRIQMGILPRHFPAFPARKDFDLHALIEPARAVGGDLYDFFLIDEQRLFFMIGDVSGKGVPAALFMALTKALYKSCVLRRRAAIGAIMTEVGQEISRENPELLFVTVFAGILDLSTGELEYANAGHDPPVVLRPGQGPRQMEIGGGPPLCSVDDFPYPAERTRLLPGEGLLLFTDGVTEARNRDGALYSMARVMAALEGSEDGALPEQLTARLLSDVRRFVDGAEPSDDIAILALRRNLPLPGVSA